MNNNKYYTPEIEEFHIGFEYEDFSKGKGWRKRVVEDLEGVSLNEDNACLDWDDYRIKYLDKEDIESLDYYFATPFSESLGYIPDDVVHHDMYYNKGVYITHYPSKNLIRIEREDKIRTPYPNKSFKRYNLFFGCVNNKSELKKLLKQLGIEKDTI